MAFSGRIEVTQAGLMLLAGAQTGGKLQYTQFMLGDGAPLDGGVPGNVVSPKAVVPLSSISRDNRGQVVLTGKFTNAALIESFVWREFGLYATGGTPGEQVLYAYGFAQEGETIPAGDAAGLVEKIIRYVARIDNASNVTIVVDGTSIGITLDQLNSAINGMMYRVAEVLVNVEADGWVEGEDGLFRKMATVAGMLPTRGVMAEIGETWKGRVYLQDVLRRNGAVELVSDTAWEVPFGLRLFVFDVFVDPGVVA